MIMLFGGQTIMAQENESKEFHRICVDAGLIQKHYHPISIGSSTDVAVMDGFYAKMGIDYSINELPIGMGVSFGLNYASQKENISLIKEKYKMNVWAIPAELHVFCLLKVPESKICEMPLKVFVMPFVGVGVERMLSWKAEYVEENIITQELDFLEKGKAPYEMKQNQLFWHLGTDIVLNKRISMKISYQRYFGYIDKEKEIKSYQFSLGLTYSFGL
jgi:hypothetical protein